MALPSDLDDNLLCEAALAILSLTTFNDYGEPRVWKGMDWDLLDALYKRGWIHDPKGKTKSVVLTSSGARLAGEFRQRHFGLRGRADLD
jgi:hypothetical protein